MLMRKLGKSGIEASAVGFGAWAIGGWMWGGTEEAEAISAIHAAIDSGINLIDTAPIYGFGTSEDIVGKAIKDRRDKVVLATKCGLVWDREDGMFYFTSNDNFVSEDSRDRVVYKHLAADSIRDEVEKSLKRLGTDHIDLYQTHWQVPTTPREETMGELLRLKEEGKIRAIGVSNVNIEQLDEYRACGIVDSDQERYSMLDRSPDENLLPYCDENDIAFLAYSPLAQGLLTGKVGPEREFAAGDQRNSKPRFKKENRVKVKAMLDEFAPVAQAHQATLGQVVIAWTLQQRGCSHVLVGARNPAQAQENATGGKLRLTNDELGLITASVAKHTANIE